MPATWDYTADVVVLGYGYAAQAAAIEADKAGSSVMILEKAGFRERGGNSRVCGQGMLAPSPAIWDAYKAYIKQATEGQGYPTTSWDAPGYSFTSDDTIKFYVENSRENIQWFTDLGYPVISTNNGPRGSWIPFYPHFDGADAIAGEDMYWTCASKATGAEPNAGAVWANLDLYITTKTDIQIKYKSPAKRLIQNPKNREILGVVITQNGVEKTVKARKAVVVAAGGYEFSPDMIRNFSHMTHCYSIGSPMNTGETIKMCWDAGAAPRNMGVTAAPTYVSAGVLPGYKSATQIANYTSAGAFIMVGRNDKRFKDEYRLSVTGIQNKAIAGKEGTLTYSGQQIQGGAYVPQPWPEPVHYIFDEAGLKSTKIFNQGNTFGWATCVEGFRGSADNSAELANGWIKQANSVAELAALIGRDPVKLQATIDKWNADCGTVPPKDTQFDTGDPDYMAYKRPAARMVPFDLNGKFYAIRVYQLTLNTQGGFVRNTKSEVMSLEGPPIPRLYAAGENGDIWTILYQCMSNMGGGCLSYGRVAGQQAAAKTAWDATTYAATQKLAAKKAAAKKQAVRKHALQKPAAK
jgi:succinate dehydrogenase/fumarate reductase flavoprotein subunit